MNNKNVQIYFGEGKGKTTAAFGQSILAASRGEQVIIVQFLKGKDEGAVDFLKRMEPEVKIFSFEKNNTPYEELTKDQKEERNSNIRNGFNYAKKVIDTNGCDVLVLDELLGVIDNGIISEEEVVNLISLADEEMDIIFTGRNLPKGLEALAGYVYSINSIKEII